jgi:hypothetical protein
VSSFRLLRRSASPFGWIEDAAMPVRAAVVSLSLLIATVPALSADRTEAVRFTPGATSATLTGTIRGQDGVNYTLDAKAGQAMTARLTADNASCYFLIWPPGSDTALFNSAMSDGQRFEGALPAAGTYRVQVYLYRNAARRNERCRYTLTVAITAPRADFADGYAGGPDTWRVTGMSAGDTLNLREAPNATAPVVGTLAEGTLVRNRGCQDTVGTKWCRVEVAKPPLAGWAAGRFLREASVTAPPSPDARVAGTPFHATGPIEIWTARACTFGVIRKGPGTADVEITCPDGSKRGLVFQDGRVRTREGAELVTRRMGDTTTILLDGGERIDIPDAAINGG